jgi:hypothetical protein
MFLTPRSHLPTRLFASTRPTAADAGKWRSDSYIKNITADYRLPVFEMPGYEADDLTNLSRRWRQGIRS